jgi:glycosyltransferase involved in cell wall biosynthesis
LNILFITSTLPRYANDGQAPFVLEQSHAWKRSYPDDRVFVLAPHDTGTQLSELSEGVVLNRFRYWWPTKWQSVAYQAILPNLRKKPWLAVQVPMLILSEFAAAWGLIRKHDIDFVFAHWLVPQGVVAYFLKLTTGVPYGLKNYSSELRLLRRIPVIGAALARRMIRSSSRLICENKLLRTEALNLFSAEEGVQLDNKVIALTMGVNAELSKDSPNEVVEPTIDFAFLGRLTGKKGVDCLLSAFTVLQREGVRFTAVIAGAGEEEAALRNKCSVDGVSFVGPVSGEKKLDLFRSARFFVFPSREFNGDIEGAPVALLEALYFGRMVIASKATNVELLPEWKLLGERIMLVDDPTDERELAGILKRAMRTPQSDVTRATGATQHITARFAWSKRIREYRSLLLQNSNGEAFEDTEAKHRGH